jgi:hypothetical protein
MHELELNEWGDMGWCDYRINECVHTCTCTFEQENGNVNLLHSKPSTRSRCETRLECITRKLCSGASTLLSNICQHRIHEDLRELRIACTAIFGAKKEFGG